MHLSEKKYLQSRSSVPEVSFLSGYACAFGASRLLILAEVCRVFTLIVVVIPGEAGRRTGAPVAVFFRKNRHKEMCI
jgi:hypothetical protein